MIASDFANRKNFTIGFLFLTCSNSRIIKVDFIPVTRMEEKYMGENILDFSKDWQNLSLKVIHAYNLLSWRPCICICIINWSSYTHNSIVLWLTDKRKCNNPYAPGTEVPNWNALQGKVKFITLAYNLQCDILLYSIWNLSPPKNNELQKHNTSGKIALKM